MTDGGKSNRVVHVITGLPIGGAQTVLHHIVSHQRTIECDMAVISLTERGEVGERIAALGTEVRALNMNRHLPNVWDLWRLTRMIRELSPSIVQTWLYHGDLLGGIAARLAGIRSVYWNIRQTDLDPAKSRRSTILTASACAKVSRLVPERIVCCSHATADFHATLGYDKGRMKVIANGVSTKVFRPDAAAAALIRNELGVTEDIPLVGLVGRYHAQKDHRTFVDACAIVSQQHPEAHFVLCGEDVNPANEELMSWLAQAGLSDKSHLLGLRTDLPAINAALDFLVSSSAFGEGFPNVVLEAMACAAPCIVTDIGESALVVGETGWTVPARQSEALACAINEALSLSTEARMRRGQAALDRVAQNYSLDAMISAYRDLYHSRS